MNRTARTSSSKLRRNAQAKALAMCVTVTAALLLASPGPAQAGKTVSATFPGPTGAIAVYRGTTDQPAPPAAAGDVFILDHQQDRIQRSSADGTFEAVWGWDVIKSDPTGGSTDLGDSFEICTVAQDCKAGSQVAGGPGAFNGLAGLAIDQTTGHLFVHDLANARIQEFDIDGDFVRMWGWDVIAASAPAHPNDNGTGFEVCDLSRGNELSDCKKGVGGAAAGQIGSQLSLSPRHTDNAIAVSPDGTVLVGDMANQRMLQFDPDAATTATVFMRGWGWNVDPAGGEGFEICAVACQAAPINPFGPNGAFGENYPRHFAVDKHGVAHVSDEIGFPATPRLLRFDTTKSVAAQLLLSAATWSGDYFSRPRVFGFAPDLDGPGPEVDRLFVAPETNGVNEYSLDTGTPVMVESHLAGTTFNVDGIGFNPGLNGGTLYVATGNSVGRALIADDEGAGPPEIVFDDVADVGESTATFNGSVDPEGFPTSYRFEYSTNGTTWTPVSVDQQIGSGSGPVAVSDEVTGLEAGRTYQARLVAAKAFAAGTATSDPVEFTTASAKPVIDQVGTVSRNVTRAVVTARINANTLPTTFQVHYGTTPAYGQVAPASPADAGSSGTATAFAVVLSGLDPATTYHFKFVATNSEGSVESSDLTFTTRASAPAPPPGRGYELVSPADKVSGVGVGVYESEQVAAATGPAGIATDGERVAVNATHGSTLADGAFNYADDHVFAERTDTGWVSHSPFTRPNFMYAGNRFASIDKASDDLSLLLWKTNAAPDFSPDPASRNGLAMFPEVADLPYSAVQHLSDWQGRWEVFGPTAAGQGAPMDAVLAVSGDATHAVMASGTRGLAGPTDPTVSQSAGRATYLNDLSDGVSDTFPGTGVRVPVGVCSEGTVIPLRTAGGLLGSQPCEPPGDGASAALTSRRGSGFAVADETAPPGVIARDGRRLFFMSPDFGGEAEPCGDSGVTTSCPAQLYVYDKRGGQPVTRWISKPEVAGQAASLLGPAYFDGATPDGDKVFFHTTSPLTADDPNGMEDGEGDVIPPPSGGVTTGAASAQSWDLYMYDFPDDPEADLGAGQLVRLSSGPTGLADVSVAGAGTPEIGRSDTALRFASADGDRVYFSTLGPLPGAVVPNSGTSTAPTGEGGRNLYLYDASRPPAQRWVFVAQVPPPVGSSQATTRLFSCVTTYGEEGPTLTRAASVRGVVFDGNGNCVRGTADGAFVTFPSDRRLVAGDPDDSSGDMYAFDATSDELTRISAPQGVAGADTYDCAFSQVGSSLLRCYGDMGASMSRLAGLVTDPASAGDRIAFFHSMSRLVPEDTDDASDVYQWRNGELSVLSTGTTRNVFYAGNSADGEDVFVMTRAQLSWQDWDEALDVYDARVGGGFPEPPSSAPCDAAAGECQQARPTSPPSPSETDEPGAGNVSPALRAILSLRALRLAQAARSGVLRLRVKTSKVGVVRLGARARIGGRAVKIGNARKRVRKAGATTVTLRLSRRARRALNRGFTLRVNLRVTQSGAIPRRVTVRLERKGSS
jgi:hypothetical protein